MGRVVNLPGTLAASPTLDEVAADPKRALDLPVDTATQLLAECTAIAGKCAAVQSVLLGRLLVAGSPQNGIGGAANDADRLLTPREAAVMLNVPRSWLRKNGRRLPRIKLSPKTVVFPEKGLKKWLATNAK